MDQIAHGKCDCRTVILAIIFYRSLVSESSVTGLGVYTRRWVYDNITPHSLCYLARARLRSTRYHWSGLIWDLTKAHARATKHHTHKFMIYLSISIRYVKYFVLRQRSWRRIYEWLCLSIRSFVRSSVFRQSPLYVSANFRTCCSSNWPTQLGRYIHYGPTKYVFCHISLNSHHFLDFDMATVQFPIFLTNRSRDCSQMCCVYILWPWYLVGRPVFAYC